MIYRTLGNRDVVQVGFGMAYSTDPVTTVIGHICFFSTPCFLDELIMPNPALASYSAMMSEAYTKYTQSDKQKLGK